MKEIYLLLKVHLKEDYNPRLYLYFLSFLTVTISLNYYFDFDIIIIWQDALDMEIEYYYIISVINLCCLSVCLFFHSH